MTQPTLSTSRLILRPFVRSDGPVVQRLAGDRAIAATTLSIPHPYDEGLAETWIETHPEAFRQKQSVTFAIVWQPDEQLCGSIGLTLNRTHNHAELGYWLGQPFWGRGICTEAAIAIVRYGFDSLNLHRIYAYHFADNPASGRVMQKIGMTFEGCCRQHIQKWHQYKDVVQYGMLQSEWRSPLT